MIISPQQPRHKHIQINIWDAAELHKAQDDAFFRSTGYVAIYPSGIMESVTFTVSLYSRISLGFNYPISNSTLCSTYMLSTALT